MIRVITWDQARACHQFHSVQQFGRWADDQPSRTHDVWFVDLYRGRRVVPCTAEPVADANRWQLLDRTEVVVASSYAEPTYTTRQRRIATEFETYFDEFDVDIIGIEFWGNTPGLYEPFGFSPIDEGRMRLCPEIIDKHATYCRLDNDQFNSYLIAIQTRLMFRHSSGNDEGDLEHIVDGMMFVTMPDAFGIMNDVGLAVLAIARGEQ